MEIVGNTRTMVRLEAKTSYSSKEKSLTPSELIPKKSSQFNVKMFIISVKIIGIFTLDWEEFFGMSSGDVELFAFDKYGISASKRTIVRVFPTVSTPHLIPNMATKRILDF